MFLLVPAHPGFPGQIPQSRKTVVCVCVLLQEKFSKRNSKHKTRNFMMSTLFTWLLMSCNVLAMIIIQ